jgi:hypothetical protein
VLGDPRVGTEDRRAQRLDAVLERVVELRHELRDVAGRLHG